MEMISIMLEATSFGAFILGTGALCYIIGKAMGGGYDMSIPRMRTAEKVLAEIKAVDPDSEVTLYYIRAMIKAGAVPVVSCGRKKLVNVDAVMDLLASGYELPKPEMTLIRSAI